VRKTLIPFGVALVVSGCGPGKSSSGGVKIDPSNFGGVVDIIASGSIASMDAQFISGGSCDPEPAFYGVVPTDQCVKAAAAGCSSSRTYSDAGPSVRAKSGATTITATRATSGSEITYSSPDTPAPRDADYQISVDGSASFPAGDIGIVHVPKHVTVTGGGTFSPGEPFTLNLSGVEGATAVDLVLSDGGSKIYACRVTPAATFVVPGFVTLDLGNFFRIDYQSAVSADKVTVNGREVLLLGVSY
jgi:hypothetical protein